LYDGASHRSFWSKQGYMREARGGYGGKEVPRCTLLDGEDAALLIRRRAFPSGVNCGHGAARGVGGSVHSAGGRYAKKSLRGSRLALERWHWGRRMIRRYSN
jgi:hypothetical protein